MTHRFHGALIQRWKPATGSKSLVTLLSKEIAHGAYAGTETRRRSVEERATRSSEALSLPTGVICSVGWILRVAAARRIKLASGNARSDQRK